MELLIKLAALSLCVSAVAALLRKNDDALALSARELTAAEEELRQQAREQSRITSALCLGGGVMLCILLM